MWASAAPARNRNREVAPLRPGASIMQGNHDPKPLPPIEPDPEDCCGEGCPNCVFDVHDRAREQYELALDSWNRRQRGEDPQRST
jgi:hypothetical protein